MYRWYLLSLGLNSVGFLPKFSVGIALIFSLFLLVPEKYFSLKCNSQILHDAVGNQSFLLMTAVHFDNKSGSFNGNL